MIAENLSEHSLEDDIAMTRVKELHVSKGALHDDCHNVLRKAPEAIQGVKYYL